MQSSPFRSMSTDDQWHPDAVLIAIIFTVFFTCLLTGYAVVVKGLPFDPSSFGTGVASILGGGGVGYAAKRFGDKKEDDNHGDRSDPELSKS